MEDFIELGIEGVDKIVDKHFHRVPDPVFDKHNYHPRNLRKLRHRRRRSSSLSTDSDSEVIMQQDPRRAGGPASPYPPEPRYMTPPIYSTQPPHLRPQYVPSPPPIGQAYPPPPLFQAVDRKSRDYDDPYYSDSARPPRRPKAVSRRSSSYHGPRNRDDYYGGVDERRRHRRPGSPDMIDKAKDVEKRYKVKDELDNVFTTSKVGIAGSAIGAVVGGWAAQKAQVATRGEKGRKSNAVLTLLGAAVGGLAVNALMDKFEESQSDKQQ